MLQTTKNMWIDGTCNSCGSDVVEGPSNKPHADYVNWCLNKECKNHIAHYIGDTEDLDYYTHI